MLYEEPQIIADAESTNILFTNWTTSSFTGRWNKKDRTIKAGDSLLLPKYLARHYAHQLAVDEMNRKEIDLVNREKYEEYFNKAMSDEEAVEDAQEAEIERLNKGRKKTVKKPAAKNATKKIKEETKKEDEEVNEEFEDESSETENSAE